MKAIILFICSFLLCSCAAEGTRVPIDSGNKSFTPEFLFEVDGVKVYRFRDGHPVYFTVPVSQTSYTQLVNSGKGHLIPINRTTISVQNHQQL